MRSHINNSQCPLIVVVYWLLFSFRFVPFVELLCKWEPGQRGVWCATSNVCLYEYHNKIISKFNVASLLTDRPAVCHSTVLCLLPGISVYIGASAAVAFMRLHLSNCQMSCPQQDTAREVLVLGLGDVSSCVTRFACHAGLCRFSLHASIKNMSPLPFVQSGNELREMNECQSFGYGTITKTTSLRLTLSLILFLFLFMATACSAVLMIKTDVYLYNKSYTRNLFTQ